MTLHNPGEPQAGRPDEQAEATPRPEGSATLLEQLEAMRHSYAANLRSRVEQMEQMAHALLNQGWSATMARELRRRARSLAGSGTTFGMAAVTEVAHRLDMVIQALLDGPQPPAPATLDMVDLLVVDMRAALSDDLKVTPQMGAAIHPGERTFGRSLMGQSRVVILGDDGADLRDLASQLGGFGYGARLCTTLEEVVHSPANSMPLAILADLDHSGTGLAAALAEAGIAAPIIFLSRCDDLPSRLQAVRQGGAAFLSRPADMSDLVAWLDRLADPLTPGEGSALLVGTDQVTIYATALREAGFQVEVTDDPTVMITLLERLRPEIVLLEEHIGGYSALDLAVVIRQSVDAYAAPLLILPSDRRGGTVHPVAPGKGDLIIPADPAQVVPLAVAALRRVRVAGRELQQERLLSAEETAVRFRAESARARADGTSIGLALLAVDDHRLDPALRGRVMGMLIRLLRGVLLPGDIAGQDDEGRLVVIMPATTEESAQLRLEAVCTRFSGLSYRTQLESVQATMSSGLAAVPPLKDPDLLIDAARNAFATAVEQGGNRVTRASHANVATGAQQREEANQQPALDLSSVRVLVADDDDDVRTLMLRWLYLLGANATVAASSEAALEAIEHNSPDLVLLDVLMPGLNGLDVLDTLRAHPTDMAIVILTSAGSERLAVDALRRGADDYLHKPLDPSDFQAVLERALNRLSLRRQNSELQRRVDEQRHMLAGELERAARIQKILLPTGVPQVPGFTFAARCVPVREVGGDFYDWHFPVPGLLNLTLGDVMGKGLAAALLMTTVRATMRAVARQTTPAINMRYASTALAPDLDHAGSFVTLFHAQLHLDTQRMSFVDSGHGLAFVRRANGSIERLEPGNLPVGVAEAEDFVEGEFSFGPGDALILFSDGLLDPWPEMARSPDVLADLLARTSGAQAILDRLLALPTLIGPLGDDLTVVVLACDSLPAHE